MTKSAFPARLILFPVNEEGKTATFFLATEEYVASKLPADDYLFAWILPPTVVMGRNQVAEAEVNFDFCRKEGIDIVRRKSGGGCIYADEGNIMFSLITREGAVEPIFNDYATTVASALSNLGIDANVSGRNDILLANGTKVCGNAFYHLSGCNIVHGTMLYDTNYNRMTGALTPDRLKLKSSGVKSVKSRVGLIKDILPIGIHELRHRLVERLTNRVYQLTVEDIHEIEKIESGYRVPEFLYGKKRLNETCRTFSKRIKGCGRIDIHITTQNGRISDIFITGDYFSHEDPNATFFDAFNGLKMQPKEMNNAIKNKHPEKSIRGLTAESLAELLEIA